MKRLLLTFLALVAMTAGAWARTYYGFVINGIPVYDDNYQSLSSNWSYDPAANVLHLLGQIDISTAVGIVITGDDNPTLNISVDGNCTLSGTFSSGIEISGSGTHVVSGTGTLNIESRVVEPTGIILVNNPSVTFKDLTVNIKQYGGVAVQANKASITFDWCEFNITTNDGMAMRASSGMDSPQLILCQADHGWGNDASGSGYRGYAGEGLYASNMKITRCIKYVDVNVTAPEAGQKPSTEVTALRPEYKVVEVNWYIINGSSSIHIYETTPFLMEQVYKVEVAIEALDDNEFDWQNSAAAVATVNGNKADFFKAYDQTRAILTYTFPALTDTYDLWIAGIQVTKQNKDNLAELVAELSEEATERYFEGDMEITYDDASQTLTLKNAIIYAATGYGIQSKLSSPKIKLIGDNTITADNGMGVRIQPGTEEPDKAVISGGGSLNIKASGVGLRSHLNLFLTDGVKITSEGDAIGFQGWKAVSSDDPLPTLTMTGPETMLRTKGTREGSFASYGQLNLQDDIRIMQPSGATFVPNIGIVNDNQLVTDEWVLIAKPARGDVNLDGTVDIADVTAVLTAMANGSHDPQYRVNDDDAVDIADVTAILTIMAGQ